MHLYGLIIGICLAIGIEYCSRKNKIIPKKLETFFILGLVIFALIGARIYHVIDQWNYYSQNLYQIFQTWNGGLGIFGGLIGGFLFIVVFSQKYKINPLKILDLITPILPLCQSIGRIGNWINGENSAWWIEAIPDLILFFYIRKYPKNPTAKYLVGYGAIRFFTEFFRQDTWVIDSIKIGQLIGLVLIIIGVNLIYRERLKIPQDHSK